jgi:chromatin remodeling complex protein RSC6
MDVSADDKKSWREVIEYISSYIKQNSLRDPRFKWRITLDANLRALFDIKDDRAEIFFGANLESLIRPLFYPHRRLGIKRTRSGASFSDTR